MNTKTNTAAADLTFSAILATALEQPGIISAAYSAFHRYSMGNQMLAAMQLLQRGLGVKSQEVVS